MSCRTIVPAQAVGRVRAPPSKSYTHRAFVAAYLAGRRCEVVGPLESDDTRATRDGLSSLGARVRRSRRGWTVTRLRHGKRPVRRTVWCLESGTTLRFLSAVAAIETDPVRFEGGSRLAVRPMAELFEAVRQLGVTVRSPRNGRALPCTVRGPMTAGPVSLRGDVSSQFISALLMVLPTLPGPSTVRILGRTVSEPYIEATLAVLRDRRIRVHRSRSRFEIPGGQQYPAYPISVPGDASSAAYLWAAGAATGGSVVVEGIPTNLPQADLAILPILSRMGARIQRGVRSVRVTGPLSRPISVDLTDSPDLYPLVAVLAALIPEQRSRLLGAPHLEFKESDRRAASLHLAQVLGARASSRRSCVEIVGTPAPRPMDLPALDDHRLVMSAAVGALAGSGASRVGRVEAVSKSFPGFWSALESLTHAGRHPS